MFIFGHLGFGTYLATPFRKRLPWTPLVVGMLAPDLLDKPIYFLGMVHTIRSTRSVGHTVLLCACLWVTALVVKRRSVTALALGVATHLVLDGAFDLATGAGLRYVLYWTTWPLHVLPLTEVSSSVLDYTSDRLTERPVLLAELAGLLLVASRVWPRAAPVRGDG